MLRQLAASLALVALPAAAAAPVQYSAQDRADINCLGAVSIILGQLQEGKDSANGDAAALTGVLTYFVGKLKGRHPDIHIVDVITPEIYAQLMPRLRDEMQRCGAEGVDLGSELEAAGKALIAASAS